MPDKATIRRRILELTAADGHQVGRRLALELGVSRQVAHGYLKALVQAGEIEGIGSTRARRYHLRTLAEARRSYPRTNLREDVVWQEVFAPVMADLAENVRDIWRYGVTEMVNNAVEHSGSVQVQVGVARNALFTDGWVTDEGEGIFLKIQRALNLYDPREAILELAKGKLTTDPARHSGEGIFFTSRVFDAFDIHSGKLHYEHGRDALDWFLEQPDDVPGTLVFMRLANDSPRRIKAVFDQFAGPEEYSFSRTVVPVRLAQHEGEKLVSRSQARRLCARFERFRHVVLDFASVTGIGQAFADEVFRVFAAAHPAVELRATNMVPEVEQLVRRAQHALREADAAGGYVPDR